MKSNTLKMIGLALVLLSAPIYASTMSSAKKEAMRLANVMIDNPAALAELNNEYVNIIDYSVTEKSNGVNVFTFDLDRTCFCRPKPGTLEIVQDLRPTMVDGPIDYSYEVRWQ